MKCNKCEKPATFHITERVGGKEQWEELHLCEDCAREYLSRSSEPQESESLASALLQHLKIGQTAEELSKLDKKTCPVCGITFYEFRHHGRLGCPNDYLCFQEQLEQLVENIHGATVHTGKRPKKSTCMLDKQTQLIRLRRDMRDAVHAEDYERASVLRDQIRELEDEGS
ncbi:MAG: DNA helicase UvrBC [Candidatus Anammoximicrobium sp.]|nr:DNA helicase UvrBC [Candidatus Anammoximicrobium sp.]